MKLHLDVNGSIVDYRIHPILMAAWIYARMVTKVARTCGTPGLLIVAGATLLFGAGYLIKTE